ncbi:SDR family NAD(P)-dependent oxidoreductase [Thalassotalea sediminis]|uniref:SDR family NAD(P)-dependent oxidoreductase n=1 Tax=Thalassotalea sediminis TaxID=1759089 RepID=UPI0025742467|nr:SDR family NAD(P)-dependent oxidoreductase [Thalassotalea sediminis]
MKTEPAQQQAILIIGANSEIAKALATKFVTDKQYQLIVITRNPVFYQHEKYDSVQIIQVEGYQECNIQAAVATLGNYKFGKIFICHGLLHGKNVTPEKRLEDFSAEHFAQVVLVNTTIPMLWLKHLAVVVSGDIDCKIVFFSARVASISDNRLGGWYSYRSAKTALNMMLKSAAVELNRRAKNIKLVAFHPGTTDSPLSKPFQQNVPKGKLFTSTFVAQQLLNIVEALPLDGELSYLDWQGKAIDW